MKEGAWLSHSRCLSGNTSGHRQRTVEALPSTYVRKLGGLSVADTTVSVLCAVHLFLAGASAFNPLHAAYSVSMKVVGT